MVGGEESVEAGQNLFQCEPTAGFIPLPQKENGDQVGQDPGIPVIDRLMIAHPPEIAAGQEGLFDPPLHLDVNPAAHLPADAVQQAAHEILDPGEEGRSLARKQVDVRVLDVGQHQLHRAGDTAVICPVVGGNAPEGFLADAPDAVDDVVGKPPFPFDALADHQPFQGAAAGKMRFFIDLPVAAAPEFHEGGCGKGGPLVPEEALRLLKAERFQLLGDLLPLLPFRAPRVKPGGGSGREAGGEVVRVQPFCQDHAGSVLSLVRIKILQKSPRTN